MLLFLARIKHSCENSLEKEKKKGMGRCKQNQKDNAHRNKILV